VPFLEGLRQPITGSRAKRGFYEAYPEKKPAAAQ
jgi:hypothetical protein